MKRLAFLLLVVLLVAAMGVPTWAVQYRPDLLPLFQTFRDFAVYKASFYCPDYPYYAIFFNSNFTIGTFVFSKTPIISVGSIIYSFEVRESWMDSDSIGAIWSDRVVDRVEGSGMADFWSNFIVVSEKLSLYQAPGTEYNFDALERYVVDQAGAATAAYVKFVGVDTFIEKCMIKFALTRNPKYSELLDKYNLLESTV